MHDCVRNINLFVEILFEKLIFPLTVAYSASASDFQTQLCRHHCSGTAVRKRGDYILLHDLKETLA